MHLNGFVPVRDPTVIRSHIVVERTKKTQEAYCPWNFVIATCNHKVLILASSASGATSWGPPQSRIRGDDLEDSILNALEIEAGIHNATFERFLGVARHIPQNGEAPPGWHGKLLISGLVSVPSGTTPSPSHRSVAACHWVSTPAELGGLMKIATGRAKRLITMAAIQASGVWNEIPARSRTLSEQAEMTA